jgi:hypothetical protein
MTPPEIRTPAIPYGSVRGVNGLEVLVGNCDLESKQ